MKVLIDLQAVQGDSRHRGIGRYSLSLARAMIQYHPSHEYILLLNGLLTETIEPIRLAFCDLVSPENIRLWYAAGPVRPLEEVNRSRRMAAQFSREAVIASINPDIVHITSLFEGFSDNAVHSIGLFPANVPTVVTFYDLIPLIEADIYLKPHPVFAEFYAERIHFLRQADLYLAISGSSGSELTEYLDVQEERILNIGSAVSENFKVISLSDNEIQSLKTRFGIKRKFLMYSGATDERKNHLRLIEAFSLLPREYRQKYQLCLVGRLPGDHKERFLAHTVAMGLTTADVIITEGVTDDELVALYNLCDLFVFPSWHEGFGLPALEAMACGAAVIGSNTTSLPEVIGRADALFDPFDSAAIAAKIVHVLRDEGFRRDLARHGLEQCTKFSWKRSASIAVEGMERLHHARAAASSINQSLWDESAILARVIEQVAAIPEIVRSRADSLRVAAALAKNHPRISGRQLLVDVSELAQRDSKSGIQRVVRSIVLALRTSPPAGFTIRLVRATHNKIGYRYANRFTCELNGTDAADAVDDVIEVRQGDIFLGLDLQQVIVGQQGAYFASLRETGVKVYFVVYDLLPISIPGMFPPSIMEYQERWLTVVAASDGLICISKTVADESFRWLERYGPTRATPLKLGWFHLGADVAQSLPTKGIPAGAGELLSHISARPSFLMVGTLEPRKGHLQTLLAFDRLWAVGCEVNLVIVGKEGWNVDQLTALLREHPEKGHRLFTLAGISDEYLEEIYSRSSCLIAASEDEGFGLPLIEAAQKNLPIIARDIPVFREVAGLHAQYFSGRGPEAIQVAVSDWLALKRVGAHPSVAGLSWSSWEQSKDALMSVVVGNAWYTSWNPAPSPTRLSLDDSRFGSQVGSRALGGLRSTGQAGFLLYGPYITLTRGFYQVEIKAFVGGDLTDCYVDVASHQGRRKLAEANFSSLKENFSLILPFVIDDHSVPHVEIRIWVGAETHIDIMRISLLTQLQPSAVAPSAIFTLGTAL